MKNLTYREPKKNRYYILQIAFGILLGILIGGAVFTLFFMLELMLGMDTDPAGNTAIAVWGVVLMAVSMTWLDRMNRQLWIYGTDEQGKIYLLDEDARYVSSPLFQPVKDMEQKIREQIAWAERLISVPLTATEVLEVYSVRPSIRGYTVRCRVRDRYRLRKRKLTLFREMKNYEIMVSLFEKKQNLIH